MLYHLSNYLQQFFGPARLLQSHALLLAGGAFSAAIFVWLFLPRLWRFMPKDRGKTLVADVGGMLSAGKPTGAGILVTLLCLPIIIVFVPFGLWDSLTVVTMYFAMLFGYLDDQAKVPWGELKKGLLDLVCALAIAYFLARGHSTLVWLPFVKGMWTIPLYLYVPVAAFVLWFTMNATNCSDGVDGLAGTLTEIALVMLAAFLYIAVGYRPVAHYLLLPCNPEAARWAIFVMIAAGGFGGYLWYNANPSQVLMGDAGSRFLGILVGVGCLVTGNPLLVLAFAPIVLVNGGGGMGKLVLLRLAKKLGMQIPDDNIIKRIRFPLHDHCRKNLNWSPAQVLMRFTLLQLIIMPALLLLLVKVR